MSTHTSFPKIALITLLIGVFALPQTIFASFVDVPSSDRNYEAINYLQESGIIRGYEDGTFRPDQLISRAELLKIVFAHAGFIPVEGRYTDTKFTDVPADSWFAPYVKKAYDLGIIPINPDIPLFYPSAPITRLDALRVIMPVEGIPAPLSSSDEPTGFTDVNPDSPYAYIARAALASGLYTQENDTRFDAFKALTRAQAAEFIYRAQAYVEGQPQNVFVINPDYVGESYLTETEAQFIDNPKFPILLDVWSKLNDEYIFKNDLDGNELLFGAIGGMVNTVDDPYTIFETPENAWAIEDDLEGTFEGIGTILDTFEDSLIIVTVLQGSPAEKAGLKAGDIITAVDGKNVIGMPIDEVVDLVKGPAGTTVKLTINRDGSVMNFSVTRDKIAIDTVIPDPSNVTVIPEDIGYIAIYQFTESTAGDFANIFADTMAANPKGFILDLRDNPGGYLDSAYTILGHFIEEGKTIMNLDIGGRVIPQFSEGAGEFMDAGIPLIVLINDGSASAAEVVAGAIQDHKIGQLLGEQSYGKGTVQEVTTYTDGSFFKLSIAKWLTPLKHDIDKVGLTPDIKVDMTKSDFLGETDSQLERAISELQ